MATLKLIMSLTNSREMRKEAIGPFDFCLILMVFSQSRKNVVVTGGPPWAPGRMVSALAPLC